MARGKRVFSTGIMLAALLFLAGCATAPAGHDSQSAKIDSVMAKAAAEAANDGRTEQSLSYLEQIYKRNSADKNAALNYAQALRESGYLNRAVLILKPFAEKQDQKEPDILIEYAAIQNAMGRYLDAEQTARRAVTLDPDSGQAYHLLGIALDAQGHHEQAKVAFDKGLEHWEGNPSAILNNIGLNLAAQGFLDDAIETLRKALDTAPNRMEVERNLRIVSALQYQPPQSGMRAVPMPPRKPAPDGKAQALKEELDALDSPQAGEGETEEESTAAP